MSKLWRWHAHYWGIWTLVGIFMATRDYVIALTQSRQGSSHFTFWDLSILNIVQYWGWGALGMIALRLASRYPLHGQIWKPGLIQLLMGIPLSFVGVLFSYVAAFRLGCMDDECGAALSVHVNWSLKFFAVYFHYSLLNFWGFQAVINGIHYYRRYKERELVASQLEAHLAQAQNTALRMQLQPHFLFNALNSVSALIHTDVDGADRMLARIGDMLRLTLDRSAAQEVSLGQELGVLEAYLDIQRQRFSDQLVIEMLVPPLLLTAQVPNLILQPLVENSFKHGLGRRVGRGRLSVRAQTYKDCLVLEVEDDGPGLLQNFGSSRGIGLANIRRRLALLYGKKQSLELIPVEPTGVSARITLPLKWA